MTNPKDKLREEKKCDCLHTMYFSVTIGDSCAHIVPHPTKKQAKKYILPILKDIIKLYEKK